MGGERHRLTLSHSVAARTAAARLRLGGVAPRLLHSLCIRGWVARGSDSRSRTASRLVLLRRVCGWAAWRPGSCARSASEGGQCAALTYALAQRRGSYCTAAASRGGVEPGPLPSRFTREGWRVVARCFDLRPRTSSRLVLLRRRRAAWRQLVPSLCTREWATRGSDCTALRLARTAAARLRLGGVAPSSCPRSARGGGRRAAPTCAGWRAAPTYALLAQHSGSCCGASAVGRRGKKLFALHTRVGGARLRLTPSRVVVAQYCCGCGVSAVGRRGAQTLALGTRGWVKG